MFDAQLGRFTGIDPICEKFYHVTTYNYAENSPIANIDLWGLQKLFFQKALDNKAYNTIYSVQRKTPLGKQFSKTLASQSKYNVMYYAFDSYEDGRVRTINTISQFKNLKSKYADMSKVQTSEMENALQDGKPLIMIGIDENDLRMNKESIKKGAYNLNHEEGAHALDILLGGENSASEDHLFYYGVDVGYYSPEDSEVENDPKYENSRAKENYDVINKLLNAIFEYLQNQSNEEN